MVRAAAEALSLQSIMRDLGWESTITVWVDSAAAKSIASRIGLGKMRHMEVKFLWLQEAVKAKRIFLKKVAGCQNPADVLTKPQGISDSASLLDLLGFAIHSRDVRRTCPEALRDRSVCKTRFDGTVPSRGLGRTAG